MSPFPFKLALALALSLPLAACSTSDDGDGNGQASEFHSDIIAHEVVTPVISLTPVPGVTLDMEAARRYEAEGDIEAAAAAYIAIAATESPARVEAAFAAARLLMDLNDHEDARTLLEPLVEELADSPEGLTGAYLLGRAYAGLEMWEASLAQFDAYIAAAGPAAPYAHLDRATPLAQLGRGIEAARSAQAGLELGVPDSLRRAFVLRAAENFERAGAFDEALALYGQLVGPGNLFGDVAVALQRIAAIKGVLGDPTYVDERDRLLTEYPGTPQAMLALEEALAADEPVHPNVHGLILYRHNEYTRAEPHFRAQIEAFPTEPETAMAYYYTGAIVESRGELDEALEHYAAVDRYHPGSSLADNALWWRARIHEDRGEWELAGGLYARIVNEYPSSPFMSDAAFRRGMLAYRAGDHLGAATIWEADLAVVTNEQERHRLQLWYGKALMQAGQGGPGASVLEPLSVALEDDYYGIRARSVSRGEHGSPRAAVEVGVDLAPRWDWQSAEAWLRSHTGQPDLGRSWETDDRWHRAQELWRVGRITDGDLEVFALIEAFAGDAGELYTLSRELLSEGRVGMSGRAGQRLLRVLEAGPSEGLPRALMSLSYPAAFGPLVQRYAEGEGISPLLMLAFVRQESFFDPRAVSPAGALGLTQVLPSTAESLAAELGVSGAVSREQLLHADYNLRLGARYMANQLARFGDDVYAALAAYNAGPGAAQRWSDAAGDDADLYLETVEFAETRLYLEIVAENYAIYRFIYAGEPEPNLP